MNVTPVTPGDVDRYLRRLGVAPGPPTLEQLVAIHRAQVERIPYETTWIHLGETWTVDPGTALVRILDRQRGGYCFHLNGALGALLRGLGYDVTTHAARVQGAADRPPGPAGDHAALVVRGVDDATWLVDAGLGDGLHEPLPLRPGRYRQGPYTFTIAHDDDGDVWHLRHDPRGSFAEISFGPPPEDATAVFAARHAHLSTSPDSGFVRAVTVQRRHAGGADILRALTLTHTTVDGDTRQVVDDRADWFAVLADGFGLHLTDAGDAARERLWVHANAAPAAHRAATPPG
jgi:N-hydroxyarylamine O-acetyltransferase